MENFVTEGLRVARIQLEREQDTTTKPIDRFKANLTEEQKQSLAQTLTVKQTLEENVKKAVEQQKEQVVK
jgi:TPP-dependent pyruvate/acetoin dehydrogenase alpha subunit